MVVFILWLLQQIALPREREIMTYTYCQRAAIHTTYRIPKCWISIFHSLSVIFTHFIANVDFGYFALNSVFFFGTYINLSICSTHLLSLCSGCDYIFIPLVFRLSSIRNTHIMNFRLLAKMLRPVCINKTGVFVTLLSSSIS